MKHSARSLMAAGFVGLGLCTSCGAATPSAADPQQPALRGQPGQIVRPAQIVICPEGSSYDSSRNTCVASGGVFGAAPTDPAKPAVTRAGDASITVRCSFPNGWVSVLPVDDYPDDDAFLMQALIGLTEEPKFWAGQSEYKDLEPYAARRCTDQGVQIEVPSGEHFVLVGQADTFNRKGRYDRNGYRRRMRINSGTPANVSLRQADLTHTWNCISCPFVAFYDSVSKGHLPAFVVLAYRDRPSRKGTDRSVVERVPVRNGRITVHVSEVDREVTHLDRLVVEVGGRALVPVKGKELSALAKEDNVGVEMKRGTAIIVEYEVPGMADGEVTATVVATGYYEPTDEPGRL